jgi:nitrilase
MKLPLSSSTPSAMTDANIVRVAVVQAEPVWLDLKGSVDKACQLIIDAAAGGAQLVSFPECFIPGYPCWIWARAVDPVMTTRYIKNSLQIDSPEMERIRRVACTNNIDVALGFSENDGNSLYMAQAIISGATGEILMKRRKIKPTHLERTVFGDASGSSLLNVVNRPYSNVGMLQCWEHIQPLLKYHTFLQREEIHVSAWPPLDRHNPDGTGLWGMSREGCAGQSQQYALEGSTFVLHTTAVISDAGIKTMCTEKSLIFNVAGGGCSAVFGPDGRCLSEPMLESEEGLIFADLNMDLVLASRSFVDACGHYSRPDMLWLGVDSREKSHLRGHKDMIAEQVPTTGNLSSLSLAQPFDSEIALQGRETM